LGNIEKLKFFDYGIKMEEMMLKLNVFSHNHHPYRVKLLAKYIGVEFRYIIIFVLSKLIYPNFFKEKRT